MVAAVMVAVAVAAAVAVAVLNFNIPPASEVAASLSWICLRRSPQPEARALH